MKSLVTLLFLGSLAVGFYLVSRASEESGPPPGALHSFFKRPAQSHS